MLDPGGGGGGDFQYVLNAYGREARLALGCRAELPAEEEDFITTDLVSVAATRRGQRAIAPARKEEDEFSQLKP
jgi:hypothetical protein